MTIAFMQGKGGISMDEDKAWENFIASGSIRDYLIYKEAKACAAQSSLLSNTEDNHEFQNRWSDTYAADNKGE